MTNHKPIFIEGNIDEVYHNLIGHILTNGQSPPSSQVRTKWGDGEPAYYKEVHDVKLFIDDPIPLLSWKRTPIKSPIIEILWIWQQKTNNVTWLQNKNVNIWNEWVDEHNTIKKAYGYQLGKKVRNLNGELVDQVDYLIHQLKHNNSSRRNVVTLWNIQDLDEMMLDPCVFQTQWLVNNDNELNLKVIQRSCDTALGLPYNIFQYKILQYMIAQVTDLKVGTMTFDIGNAHIYDRHIKPMEDRYNEINSVGVNSIRNNLSLNIEPKNSFYDFTENDFTIEGYKPQSSIKLEVAE